ncbi:iron-containing alcohol dehydrogenase [Clostridium sp. Marseille-P3244]|uniref:iron-containing alcohol dehydrogenase n=1 Tax=Clostridium sp. Marseille-P3244 TaxID=1871020 RepID=UPI0011600D30|nr:iron-containing alcohol dehydrogenase [Clostridium sp. Marseille-P3244]
MLEELLLPDFFPDVPVLEELLLPDFFPDVSVLEELLLPDVLPRVLALLDELSDFLLSFPPQAVADTAMTAIIARISPLFKNPFFFLFTVTLVCMFYILSFSK